MTSYWGMGLVANDGAHGWAPGNAAFADPRGGDRVLRVMLASGPLTRFGITAAAGFDWVQGDDAMIEDDSARQGVAAVTVGAGHPHSAGVYGVYRRQTSPAGDRLTVGVVDVYGRTSHALPAGLSLAAEAEAALITGQTTLAATVDYPEQNVLQLGAALRVALSHKRLGGVLEILYAAGDASADDDQQNAFKPDPNFEMGLLLFRHVLAGHTGRAVATAGDPEITGVPSQGLERFPTRGSASNTVALFPRGWWRPLDGLEIYAGPLFAFTVTESADPFNTRLAGGVARNALDGAPGRYLGTELDGGVRFRALLFGTELTVGAEGGVLLPGSALAQADGSAMSPVVGGRFLLDYRF
jgi:hypothetical protein